MVRILLVLNTLLTLPFGIAALFSPDRLFAEFGLSLDAAGCLVARGYGATLVGFGTLLFLLRKTTDPGVVRSLLVALFLFNLRGYYSRHSGGPWNSPRGNISECCPARVGGRCLPYCPR